MNDNTIGLCAGGGQFPFLVARNARSAGKRVVACGFIGHTDPSLSEFVDVFQIFNIGQFGKALNFLKSNGVTRLCMAGHISKPKLMDLRPDKTALKFLFTLHNNRGDDALLRSVIDFLKENGIEVLSTADLVPEIRCPKGVLGKVKPNAEMHAAFEFGWPRLAITGRLDIGQCMVVHDGIVVALECMEGTDATLKRAGDMGIDGCIAIKMAKPSQERRVDLPSVGLTTMQVLAECKYSGIILQAGQTLFFDRDAAIEVANKNGICVWAVSDDDIASIPRLPQSILYEN